MKCFCSQLIKHSSTLYTKLQYNNTTAPHYDHSGALLMHAFCCSQLQNMSFLYFHFMSAVVAVAEEPVARIICYTGNNCKLTVI